MDYAEIERRTRLGWGDEEGIERKGFGLLLQTKGLSWRHTRGNSGEFVMIVEPCNQERAEWPDATRAYVEGIELRNKALLKQRFETQTFNNIKDCPWCDRSPAITEVPSGKFMLSCINQECEVQPYTSQQTKLKAILAWNRRNSSLELTADHCDYYEQELIPQLKARVTDNLRLAELRDLVQTYFYAHEIGCECCTVRNCGECVACLIMEHFVEEAAKNQ